MNRDITIAALSTSALSSPTPWGIAKVCAGLAIVIAGLSSAPAIAAEEDQEVAAGEIVVTANKREERLRDVPASVTVVTGEQLAAVGPVTNTADLVSSTPGVRFNNLANQVLSEVSIRGSGTQRATGADSSVGLYANGVYIGYSGSGGRNFAPIDSFDVERVEVLTGPQSALYGRNAEFGVINLISAKPKFETSGEVASARTFETSQTIGSLIANFKVSDSIAVRVSAQGIDQNGGFAYNPTRDTYYDVTEGYIVRGQIRFRSGDLDVNLLAQRQDMDLPAQWSSYTFEPADTITGYPGNSNFPKGFIQDPRRIPANGDDSAGQIVNNLHLSADYELGWANLVTTASYRQTIVTQNVDVDRLDVATLIAQQTLGNRGLWPFQQTTSRLETKSYYVDMHLAGAPAMDGKLTWLAGFEYLSQPQEANSTATQDPCASLSTAGGRQGPNLRIGRGVCGGTPTIPTCTPVIGVPTCFPVASPYGRINDNRNRYKSWAAYASLKYELVEGLNVGGELRYSKDTKSATSQTRQLYTGALYPFLSGGTIPDKSYDYDADDWSYSATLSYKIPGTEDLLYAKVGRGYRVGGFNTGASSPPLILPPYPTGIGPALTYAPATPDYGPEHNMGYEVGFKGNLGRRTYFSLAAYWNRTTDALTSVNDGCALNNACLNTVVNYVVNAGTVKGWGLEGQVSGAYDLAGGKFSFNTSVSHQRARFSFVPTTGPNGERLNGLPIVDTEIAQNPSWLVDATANYKREIVQGLDGFINLHYHGQWGGRQDVTVSSALPAFAMDNFEDLDLRAGIQFEGLEVAFVARNLTNETHRLAQFSQAGTNTVTGAPVTILSQQRLSLPRTYGIELKFRW
jgi:iron complex outermembrane receptor protein